MTKPTFSQLRKIALEQWQSARHALLKVRADHDTLLAEARLQENFQAWHQAVVSSLIEQGVVETAGPTKVSFIEHKEAQALCEAQGKTRAERLHALHKELIAAEDWANDMRIIFDQASEAILLQEKAEALYNKVYAWHLTYEVDSLEKLLASQAPPSDEGDR